MTGKTEQKKIFILLLLLVGPGLILIFLSKAEHKFKILPFYGEREIVVEAGVATTDTLYHRIPDFEFTNQFGKLVKRSDFDNNIVVADFFFTTCGTICPIMTQQLARLQWMLDDPAYDDVKFLSHTVNPNNDSAAVLKEYGIANGADFDRWTFVTGSQDQIFEQGFQGYLLSTQEDQAAEGGFLHSSMLVLLDKNQHIRGYYDGTSTKDVDDLFIDIKMLKKEETLSESEKIR